MRGLDCLLPVFLGDIGDQKPLLDELQDQWLGVLGDFGKSRHAPPRRTGVGINHRQPGNQTGAEQSQAREESLWDFGVLISGSECTFDRGFDRALDAAEVVVVGELELTVGMIFVVEPFECECEQRKCIGGAAGLDVIEQRIHQTRIDLERTLRAIQAPSWTDDQLRIAAFRHRRQPDHVLTDAVQFLGQLQTFVVVRADGEHGDDAERVLSEQRRAATP